MAYTTGTAASHYDLLVKLRAYLIASTNWTVQRWVDDGGATLNGRGSILNVVGPGAGPLQNVYVNISTVNDLVVPFNSWQISTSLGFSPVVAWGNQNNESPQPFLNLWNKSLTYWFFVNDRRIIVVAQTSTTFVSSYMGLFLPWANPAQYPMPLYVAGDFSRACDWGYANTGRRMLCDPGQGAGFVRDSLGLWKQAANEQGDNSINDAGLDQLAGQFAIVWPWASGNSSRDGGGDVWNSWNVSGNGQASGGALDAFVPTAQGERFIWPTMLIDGISPPLGTLDGIYCSFGQGLSATATIVVSGRTFIAFQNVARNSGNDFFLVEEV